MSGVVVAYTEEYLDWRLGPGHPTNPARARIAVDGIQEWALGNGVDLEMLRPALDWDRIDAAAGLIHDRVYLARVHQGLCDEWTGRQGRLTEVAGLMLL